MIALPPWLDAEAWGEFLKARRLCKRPMTDYAQKLALAKLDKLRSAGHDPNASVQQSILNGWSGLFEPKPDDIRQAGKSDYERTKAHQTAEDQRARNLTVSPDRIAAARALSAARKIQ